MDIKLHKPSDIQNLSDYISNIAEQYPEKNAILYPKKISFMDFQKEIDLLVHGFNRIGIKKGSKALLLVKPGEQMFKIVFAIIRIGAIPVLIDPGMGPKAMSNALAKLKVDIFIGDPKAHLLRLLYPASFHTVTQFITTDALIFMPAHNISSIRSGNWKPSTSVNILPNDKAAIFFTSGSTGPAKAVLYRNSMLHAQIKILKDHFNYGIDEVDCCTFPLTSLLVMCLGLSIVFSDMNMTKPATLNPKKLIRNIQEYNCTHLFCSPMVLRKLADYGTNNDVKLPSLKMVMTAGAIVPVELLIIFKKLLIDNAEIHTPYGATEALPVSDIGDTELNQLYSSKDSNNHGICIGYPLPGIDIKIIYIDDNEVSTVTDIKEMPVNEVGEIIVKGPVVTQEYLGMDNPHYGKIWDPENILYWHRMGDLGRKDDKGRTWFYGRKSQRVITKNVVLYTTVTEAIFNTHPKVSRTALIGIKNEDDEYDRPVICIQLKKKANKKEKDKIIVALENLAQNHNITITSFVFFRSFPVDPRHNAKIYREKLAKLVQL